MTDEYLRRMQKILPDFEKYKACLDQAPYKGIRVNTLKISVSEFKEISPFALEQVEWEPDGFLIGEEKPGRSVYHDAGLFYVQEPSAMCAAPLLEVKPGERVLDLCSAPGGKGTQLAQAMRGEGILVLNEKIADRAKILLQNVERMGIVNAVVTNADPSELSERLEGYFDKVLVDAPCSGEGMLRKEAAAAENWSLSNVEMCAARQKKILESAAKLVTPGGMLVYSTCTFSEEEDERNVEWFVREFPQFELLSQRKIYPHREKGEGHFAALFRRCDGEKVRYRVWKPFADKKSVASWKEFEREFLKKPLCGEFLTFGKNICLVPAELFSLDGLRVLRAGLLLGENAGKRFEPAHALAMGADRNNLTKIADLDDEQIMRYLHGEELPPRDLQGWCVAAYHGYPIGLAKNAGALKNHYPKGLRR